MVGVDPSRGVRKVGKAGWISVSCGKVKLVGEGIHRDLRHDCGVDLDLDLVNPIHDKRGKREQKDRLF